MNTMCAANFLQFISHIKVLSNYRTPFYIVYCGATPVADREVQFLSDTDVAE